MKTEFQTKNNLPEDTRRQAIALLNENLADLLDLRLQTKQAHWNVKGPSFFSLHELFDKLAEVLDGFADEVAERAAALGGVALGTARVVAGRSRLAEYPLDLASGRGHVAALSTALAAAGASIRAAIDTATGLGDAGTADLFTEVSRGLDQYLWFVEAHAQADH